MRELLDKIKKESVAGHDFLVDTMCKAAENAAKDAAWDATPKAWGYIRVSHEDSVASGGTLEAQRKAVVEYIEFLINTSRPDLIFGGIYEDDGVSAYTIPLVDRPKGKEMDNALRRGDVVVFPRMDRAFRDVYDFLHTTDHNWTPRGITVIFLDPPANNSTPYGRLCLQIAVVFAEHESAIKSARVKEKFETQLSNGYVIGRAPLYFKNVGPRGKKRRVPDDKARKLGAAARYLREAKEMTWEEIGNILAEVEAEVYQRKANRSEWNLHRARKYYMDAVKIGIDPSNADLRNGA